VGGSSTPAGRAQDRDVTGAKLAAAGIATDARPSRPDQEVVVTRFPPVKKGQSIRLRLSETYTRRRADHLDGDELVFDRSFGRPRNAVVLPRGGTSLAVGPCRHPPDSRRPDRTTSQRRPDAIAVADQARRLAS